MVTLATVSHTHKDCVPTSAPTPVYSNPILKWGRVGKWIYIVKRFLHLVTVFSLKT